jgi:hypothetical protein
MNEAGSLSADRLLSEYLLAMRHAGNSLGRLPIPLGLPRSAAQASVPHD